MRKRTANVGLFAFYVLTSIVAFGQIVPDVVPHAGAVAAQVGATLTAIFFWRWR